jgi:rhodanese-related sulfurtransferase
MKTRRSIDDMIVEARTRIGRLSPSDAWKAMTVGGLLVDLRCEDDRRRSGIVPGSIHIPRTVLEWRADPTSPWRDDRIARLDARIVLLCNDGFSSSLAGASLCDLGFSDVGDVIGGFTAWRFDGLPVIAPEE